MIRWRMALVMVLTVLPASNAKASCAGGNCGCEELDKATQVCSAVLHPAKGPRDRKLMKECYMNVLRKRREALARKMSCPQIEKAARQADEIHQAISSEDRQVKDMHISGSRSLENFGMDLMGLLGGDNQRSPASGN
ncbi:MAG: hypothetical protein C5B49_03555 [Bdellovibrio sp.]|nr:MAG: hypothetical protein C5B49_03555 [Bdellovibrio sp.]